MPPKDDPAGGVGTTGHTDSNFGSVVGSFSGIPNCPAPEVPAPVTGNHGEYGLRCRARWHQGQGTGCHRQGRDPGRSVQGLIRPQQPRAHSGRGLLHASATRRCTARELEA
jgi:hypothetical protein